MPAEAESIRFTLLSDGPSDRVLLEPISWLLRHHSDREFVAQWADLRPLPNPPRSLEDRVTAALHLVECEVLFVHRDAERRPRRERVQEVRAALSRIQGVVPPAIAVVPVRMQEAWFLFDEDALRKAAGNPNGREPLSLPRQGVGIEGIADPKARLAQSLRAASGLVGRRLNSFDVGDARRQLAELIIDYAPLRALPAFSALEADVAEVISNAGWQRV